MSQLGRSLSRRHLLAGSTAASLLASIFDPRRAGAAVSGYPQRLLIFGHMNGQITSHWRPTTGPTGELVLTETLKSLEPWKSRMLFVDGLHLQSAMDARVDAHHSAISGILTGRADPVKRVRMDTVETTMSIDQFVAPALRGPARLRSAEVVLGPYKFEFSPCINFPSAGGRCLPYISGAESMFDRLFAGATGTPSAPAGDAAALARLRARRASVFDNVAKDLTSLGARVGSEDRVKLETHLAGIRDIEKQLTAVGGTPATCSPMARPKNISDPTKTQMQEAMRLQLDLIVQAFACDVTRVMTFCPSDTSWNSAAPFAGVTGTTLHAISHGSTWPQVGPVAMRFVYEQMAYLLKGLSSVREGQGTLLDNTLILSISEFGQGGAHSHKNLPIILVGSAGGYFKQGKMVQFNGAPHNDLLLSVAEALGTPTKTFGDAKYCTGPLGTLRA